MSSARVPPQQQPDFHGPDTPTFDLSWDYNYDSTLAAPPNNVPPVVLSGVSSDNRFTIRGPSNEALYGALETSDPKDRFWGSLRPFRLSLIDRSHQEVLLFKKNLGCGVFCCFCKNQFLEVWANPGELIGCIQQDYGLLSQEIVLLNSDINTMFRIPIPFANALRMPKETHFPVMDRDLMTQKGTITRAWNVGTSSYTNNIYYSDPTMDVKFKSLFIAAAFLLVSYIG
uniref:Phospholipid scramblase n=1 Tax=Anopheles atroparvus TaxID=41427 RepID=A0A182IVZ0_ANOAO